MVALSGRYEYKNKGIDVFLDALNMLRSNDELAKEVVVFIMVPAWVKEARVDLQERLNGDSKNGAGFSSSLSFPFITHNLHEQEKDPLLSQLRNLNFTNSANEKVKVIFVPSYLNGNDGIFNTSYYDLLIGLDLTVFPSYYEPWGYTPHESVAFSIPTVTTSLSGFGKWAVKMGDKDGIDDGIEVIFRNDDNSVEVSEKIADSLISLSKKNKTELAEIRNSALHLADLADWSHFIEYYQEAYSIALHKSVVRIQGASH